MNHLPVKAVKRLEKIAALCISSVWSGELVSSIEDPRLLNSKNCLAGGWTMQSLIDKYGSRTVQGGALYKWPTVWTAFWWAVEVSCNKISYRSVPAKVCQSTQHHFGAGGQRRSGALRANKATSGCSADFVIFNIAGAHQKVCRRANVDDVDASNLEVCLPAFMNALTKFTVKSARVAIRQAIALITLLLENIADEERSPTFSCVNYYTSCVGWSRCFFVYIIHFIQTRRIQLPYTRSASSSPPGTTYQQVDMERGKIYVDQCIVVSRHARIRARSIFSCTAKMASHTQPTWVPRLQAKRGKQFQECSVRRTHTHIYIYICVLHATWCVNIQLMSDVSFFLCQMHGTYDGGAP